MFFAKIAESEITDVDTQILNAFEQSGNSADLSEYRDLISAYTQATDEPLEAKLKTIIMQIDPIVSEVIQEKRADVDQKLNEVSSYRGPGGHRISERLLIVWISQFPTEFRREALQLFLNIKYLDRDDFVAAIRKVSDNLPVNGTNYDLCVAPLTTSGDFLNYYSGDIQPDDRFFIRSFKTVSEATKNVANYVGSREPVLVIVDDVLGMGIQSSDVLRIWFGEEPKYESHSISESLPSEGIKWLQEHGDRVFMVFGFALIEGKHALVSNLKHYQVESKILSYSQASASEGAFSKSSSVAWPSEEHRDKFMEYCLKAGRNLLQDRARLKKWSDEKLSERALGYSKAAQLIATSYNCPTITLPILWAEGKVDGKDWIPLFRRRFRS